MTPDNVHIRIADNTMTFCGSKGGSISFRHFAEQKDHVKSLPMCPWCYEWAGRKLQEKQS